MTTQEAYEKARAYLTRPGARQSVHTDEDACMYEIEIDGEIHHCGVGCLLEPETLNQVIHIDNEVVQNSNHKEDEIGQMLPLRYFSGGLQALWLSGYKTPELNDVDGEFLAKLQHMHDDSESWGVRGFRVERLDEAAQKHGLELVAG